MRLPWREALACGTSLPLGLIYFALAGATPNVACGQLEMFTNWESQCVFAGEARKIAVVWHNASDAAVKMAIRTRILQTSSATAVQIGETPWKELEVLPRQTISESAKLDFPAVKAETKFLVQWIENSNHILGATEIFVCPTNLLHELKTLLGEVSLGVLDPNGELKPVLKQNSVEYSDLEETALGDFQGKLAIIGPFRSKAQMREGLTQAIQKIARKGVAVVWIQPPPGPKEEIKPSFYVVPEGKGSVVIVQPDLVARFPENPKSQLNMIYLCKLALNPAPFSLPNLTPQP
jgi:hypothetical protein